jgi:Uma2 family endonuclease
MRAHLQRTAFTEAEYHAMEEASSDKHEYIDGAIYDMAGGDETHAAVGVNVTTALAVRLRGGPCRAYSSDLRLWSPEARAYVYADASVVCGPVDKSDRKGDRLSVKNPVVVIEVVSPGSEDYDRTDKRLIYQSIPTVQDYLVVDPGERTIAHHHRTASGGWVEEIVSSGVVALVGVPVVLPVDEVFLDLPGPG